MKDSKEDKHVHYSFCSDKAYVYKLILNDTPSRTNYTYELYNIYILCVYVRACVRVCVRSCVCVCVCVNLKAKVWFMDTY